MTLHVRTQIRVTLNRSGGGVKALSIEAEVPGMPPRRWIVNGPINETDVYNAASLTENLKSELRGLTLDEYISLPTNNRFGSVSDVAIAVTNIRENLRRE